MPPHRKIVFARRCEASVEHLGGWRPVDRALDSILDALSLDPYGFRALDSDWYRCRYAITKPIGDLPGLVWIFRIEPGIVTIEDVEPYEDY